MIICNFSGHADAADCTWKQTSGAFASNNNNWENGTAPTTGDIVYFSAVSTASCTWDVTATINAMIIKANYSGTITQSSNINIGAGGYYQASGTLTGSTSYTFTDAGSFYLVGGTIADQSVKLVLTGTGKIYSANIYLYSASVSGSYTSNTNFNVGYGSTSNTLSVSGTLTIASSFTIRHYYVSVLSVTGTINGAGNMIWQMQADQTVPAQSGSINVPLTIQISGSSAASRTLSFGASQSFGSSVTVTSLHATYTCTLNLGGYSLTSTSTTVGVRGILLGNGNVICSSNFDSYNGTTSGAWSLTMTGTSSPYIKTPAGNTINGLTFTTTNLRLASNLNVTKTFYVGGTYTLGTKTITVGSDANVTITAGNSWAMMSNRYWGRVNVTGTLTTTGGTYSLWMNSSSAVNGTVTSLVKLHANAFFTFRGSLGYLYLETAYRSTFFANGTASYIVWNTTGQWNFRPNVQVYPGYIISKANMYYIEPTGGYYIYITRFDTSILFQMQVTHWGNESWEFSVKNEGITTTLFTYNLLVPDLDDTEVIIHIDDANQEVYPMLHGAITFTSSIAPGVTHTYLLVSNDADQPASTITNDMIVVLGMSFTLLALLTYAAFRAQPFYIIAGFAWITVALFEVQPIQNTIALLCVGVGLIFMLWGVYKLIDS